MNKLLACTAALVLLLGTQTSFADHRDHGNRGHSYDRHDRHDHDRGRGWGRRDRDRHDHDNVSVSLSFGNVWGASPYDWRYRDYRRATSGVGIAYTTTWGAPAWGYNNRPVIVQQNNTYVNTAPRTRVVTRPGRNSTSLFRDINGRCYEREIDGRGTETRTEIPASECDF
jgi:hypothetical protein